MTKSRKCILLVVVVTAWFVVGWTLYTRFNSTPSEQFSTWINARRSPIKIGFLEKTANRYGIHYFAETRAKADRQLSEDLLKLPDFSVVVASRLDTDPRTKGRFGTWPRLEAALGTHFQNPDPQSLRDALLLPTKKGFSAWELTLARSAALDKSEEGLANTLEELRRYENRYGLDSSLSASLGRVAELYPLPAHQLARLLLSLDNDPDTDKWIKSILADRDIGVGSALSQLLRELQSGPLLESDWGIVEKLINESEIGFFRTELLVWLLLSPGCESYRAEHLPDLVKTITALAMTDQEYGRALISEVFHLLTEESTMLSSDWTIVAGLLANRVAEEGNLSNLITSKVGSDFIWIVHKLDKVELLDRAILEWGDSLTDPYKWIGHFIDREHYSAVCRVIETSEDEIIAIESWQNRNPGDKPKNLSYYTGLIDKIVPHTGDPQVKGFIRLVILMRAEDSILNKPNEEAKAEVLRAIQLLNHVEPTSRLLLEQTVIRLVEEDKNIFEAGRPCFDKWREGTTLDTVIGQIYRGDWEPGKREMEIWKAYAEKVESLDEAPGLRAIIETIRKMPPEDEDTEKVASRLKDFFAISQWGSSKFEFDHVELAIWPLKRMISDGDLAGSVDWMFTLVRDYLRLHPEENEGPLLDHFYEELNSQISDLPFRERVKWLELVLNVENSGEFDWPGCYYLMTSSDSTLNTEEAIEIFRNAFISHPLRPWLVRNLMENAKLRDSGEDEKQVLNRIQEGIDDEWLIEVIEGLKDYSINPDDFERDMATAPAGARRHFLSYIEDHSFKRHSTKRKLTEDELVRLLFWQAEQLLELVERIRPYNSNQFKRVFENLLGQKEDLKNHPRMQNIIARLNRVSVDVPRPGMHSVEVEELAQWQARTAPLGAGAQSEIDILLTNEALPVAERAWALVLKNHHVEARRLMEERANELNFAYPPNTDSDEFLTESTLSFPGTFPENSMLRIYAELYLETRRSGNPYVDRAGRIGQSWLGTAKSFEIFEETPRKLARRFEGTEFTERILEQNIFYILSQVRGIADLMPTKASGMSSGKPNEFIAERLRINNFEAQLALGDLEDISEKLATLDTQRWSYKGRIEGLHVLRYYLWRKCILNEELQPAETKILEMLCTEEFTAKVLLGYHGGSYSNDPNLPGLLRMRAIHFALALIEKASSGTFSYTWSNFDGIDYDLYRSSWTGKTDFFIQVAEVVAARTRDRDEESRWKWMALFQTDPPGSLRAKPLRTFRSFAGTGYVSKDELKRRGRDFALKFPEDGWSFLTLAWLGKGIDPSLTEFGLTQAERYIKADPKLRRDLDLLTGPSVRND